MKRLVLQRLVETRDGTFGMVEDLHTLEEEATDLKGHPRIPAGVYLCRRSYYHKGSYETFEVTGVPGRSRILFHAMNTEEDTDGCIGLGLSLQLLRVDDEDDPRHARVDKLALKFSRLAFDRFMERMAGVTAFQLEIRDADAIAPEVSMQPVT